VDISAIHVPGLLGVDITRGRTTTLRINAGLAATFIHDVRDNALGLEENDVEAVLLGARGGIGIDVAFVTFDLDFERGLTDLFVDEFAPTVDLEVRNDVLKVSLGLRFP
jgi:hypothetical protein